MAYWKCTEAEILEDGRVLKLSFKDEHGATQHTSTMAAEFWAKAWQYHFENDNISRRLNKSLENMCSYTVAAIINAKEIEDKTKQG